MQKVDIAIGAIGAVALLATGLGIALYDDINGLTHYDVDTVDQAFTNSGDVPDGGITWEFNVPDNAFHAVADLTVTFAGANPSLSGSVDVTVTITGPDGSVDTFTDSFDFSSGSGTMALSSSGWASPPAAFSGTEEDAAAKEISWTEPLTVDITIQGPSGQLPIATQDDPTYTAELDGTFHVFAINPETPAPENV